MKNHFARRTALFLVAAVFALGVLSGCETCKGFQRDLKDADAWMQDNLW